MSTRGCFGFKKNGTVKVIYNHFDSYPEGLGRDFVEMLMLAGKDRIAEFFDKMEVIDPSVPPTDEQKEYCREHGWCNTGVSGQSEDDWYCMLYGLQNTREMLKMMECGEKIYLENSVNFLKDSLFCEYAYIYNIDTEKLEFYTGFQTTPQPGNPLGEEPNEGGYYPCKLVLEIPVIGHSCSDILDTLCKCE